MAEPTTWLLISKVPVEPARARAMVWRHLKALAAVYLQDGVAALPASSVAERALGAEGGATAAQAVAHCEDALERVAQAVQEAQGDQRG